MLELRLDRPRTTFCRRMARKAFRRCAGVFTEGWPTDIARALELVAPGFILVDLESLPQGVGAIVDIERRCIGVNISLSVSAKRCAIAHEIGHVWLDHPGYVFGVEGRQDSILECEANIFAREFLIPLDTLKTAFRECRDWEKLTVFFDVTRETMYYRFREAGLLRQVW